MSCPSDSDSARDAGVNTVRKLLAALCEPTLDAETRATIVRRLKTYRFIEPDHVVIYRALSGMTTVDGHAKQELTQAVTRLGFPDVDLDWLFSEPPIAKNEIQDLLERL
jgi:hypothetical protein